MRRSSRNYKRKLAGTAVAIIGFLLSPLSWWNDLFINVPIAYALASVVSMIFNPVFLSAFIVGYWITNVLGFILMHQGVTYALSDKKINYTKQELLRTLGLSLIYTVVVVLLVIFGIVEPIQNYFS